MYKANFYWFYGRERILRIQLEDNPNIHLYKTWEYQRDIADLLGINTTKLKKILMEQYNAKICGKGYHSLYVFYTEKDCQNVKEYIETLLVGRVLANE